MSLRVGETYVHGLSSELAQALMQAADDADVDRHTIRVSDGGFVVPNEVHEQLLRNWAADEPVI